MSKLTKEEFQAYLKQIRELARDRWKRSRKRLKLPTSSRRSSTIWQSRTTYTVVPYRKSTADGA